MAAVMRRLSVKQAADIAKDYVRALLGDEGLSDLGLEEIDFDDNEEQWLITVGFSRPWNTPRSGVAALTGTAAQKRAYRVVRITQDGDVLSMKRRLEDE